MHWALGAATHHYVTQSILSRPSASVRFPPRMGLGFALGKNSNAMITTTRKAESATAQTKSICLL